MQNTFKTLFIAVLAAGAAHAGVITQTDVTVVEAPVPAKQHHFSSGVGLTLGLGVTTAGTKGNNGAGGTIPGIQGFKKSSPAVAGVPAKPAGALILPPLANAGFIEGGVIERNPEGRVFGIRVPPAPGTAGPENFIPANSVQDVPATPAVPPVPASVITEGKPNDFIDFSSPASVKNNSGFAFVGGLFAQHVSHSGFTMGGRWLFGRSGASSTLKYNSGPLLLADSASPSVPMYDAQFGVQANDTQAFRLKDKWFTAFIAELGYTSGRMQVYFGPGVAFHRQKLSLVNSSGKVAAGLTKTVTSPMFALGTRFAVSKRASIGVEWQRHIGGKKTWNNIAKIAPENMQCAGAPTTKMNNNLFLVTMNYVFNAK